MIKHRWPNEHIGSMAALHPLENVCGNASLSPAGKCWEAATAPICHHVRRQFCGKCSRNNEKSNIEIEYLKLQNWFFENNNY
jgi:hypothetical protein